MTTSITAFPITAKQIAELTSASSAAGTDFLMAQQGTTGTAYRKMTVAQIMASGAAVLASGVTVNAATVPANGMYLPAANTLGWAVNTTAEVRLTSSALSPAVSDGNALGTTSLMWADAFLASGAVINFNAGNYTLTHSAGLLTASGALAVTGTVDVSSHINSSGNITAGAALAYSWFGRSVMTSPSDGVITIRNNANTDFARLQFGGTTSSFPAIKRNATALNFRLADDSADAPITAAAVSLSGQLTSTRAMNTATGGGQIYLNGATGNRIDWVANGVAPPAFTTRSAGTKLVLYPNLDASNADYGFGIESGALWSGVASTAAQFKWYAGTTLAATLTGAGALSVGSSGNTLTITPNTTSGTAITLVGGGTGGLTFAASGGVQVAVTNTASAVNYVAITGAATGSGVKLSALGSDAVIHLRLAAKASGSIIAENNIVLQATKVLVVDSSQVVGARDTGWTAMTGTTNKATVYDTSTVTLAQLAGRVAALQNALSWHGLIGA